MVSSLLTQWWPQVTLPSGPVLDLACGSGRNGLWLARQGVPVVFLDRDTAALDRLATQIDEESLSANVMMCDLEVASPPDLGEARYAAILVFRYLHRPLFPRIQRALMPGGVLFYETFTIHQPQFGRPTNPDFLLKPGELAGTFAGWEQCYSQEHVDFDQAQAIAQWVGRKPVG